MFAIVDDKEVVAEGHRWRGKFVRTRHDEGLTARAPTSWFRYYRPRRRSPCEATRRESIRSRVAFIFFLCF